MSLISLEESVGSAGCPLIPRVNGKAAVLECQSPKQNKLKNIKLLLTITLLSLSEILGTQ